MKDTSISFNQKMSEYTSLYINHVINKEIARIFTLNIFQEISINTLFLDKLRY